jgi:hypothetical protein
MKLAVNRVPEHPAGRDLCGLSLFRPVILVVANRPLSVSAERIRLFGDARPGVAVRHASGNGACRGHSTITG